MLPSNNLIVDNVKQINFCKERKKKKKEKEKVTTLWIYPEEFRKL